MNAFGGGKAIENGTAFAPSNYEGASFWCHPGLALMSTRWPSYRGERAKLYTGRTFCRVWRNGKLSSRGRLLVPAANWG